MPGFLGTSGPSVETVLFYGVRPMPLCSSDPFSFGEALVDQILDVFPSDFTYQDSGLDIRVRGGVVFVSAIDPLHWKRSSRVSRARALATAVRRSLISRGLSFEELPNNSQAWATFSSGSPGGPVHTRPHAIFSCRRWGRSAGFHSSNAQRYSSGLCPSRDDATLLRDQTCWIWTPAKTQMTQDALWKLFCGLLQFGGGAAAHPTGK